jgi:hypothetical protein
MTFGFLDHPPSETLREWEKNTIACIRELLEATRPRELDTTNAYAVIKQARPLKGRHLEIYLPHKDDETASLTLAEDDHEFEIDTYYGDFRWDGNQLPDVERFLMAAVKGELEYEIIFKDGSPKRCRAWRVDRESEERSLLGEIHAGWREKDEEWARAKTKRPSSFL